MRKLRLISITACAWAILLSMPAFSAQGQGVAQSDEFKSTSALVYAVPDDAFFCVSAHKNPERAFLDAYWAEIFDALKDSGLGNDMMSLISPFVPDEKQGEVTRLTDLAKRLIAGVDWSGMTDGDSVFAMRMPVPVRVGDALTVGPPGELWLFRGSKASADKNFQGLVAILEAIASEINQRAGTEALVVDKGKTFDAPSASLQANLPGGVRIDAFALSVAKRDGVIVIALGMNMFKDALGLMAGSGKHRPIAEAARYRTALGMLPKPEDSAEYFDMQAMIAGLERIADETLAAVAVNDVIQNARTNPEATDLNAAAFDAYNDGDLPKALQLIEQAHAEEPTDSVVLYNLACLHALAGHKDKAVQALQKSVDAGFYAPDKIQSDGDLKTLRDDPRYATALAQAKQMAKKQGESPTWLGMVRRIIDRVLDMPRVLDYTATVAYTDGHSTHRRTVWALAPDAGANPFLKVVSSQKPVADFAKFVPKEATGYTVQGCIDLDLLVRYVEDTVRSLGPPGEQLLARWEKVQENAGFDLRKDLLSWIHGESVTVNLLVSGKEGSVMMIRVTDEQPAREKLDIAMDFLTTQLPELAKHNPMMGMLQMRTMESTKLEGFRNVYMGMSPMPFSVGVANGFIIAGAPEDAVSLCLKTGKGEHPNVRENEQVMAEALVPEKPVQSIRFSDDRKFGQTTAGVLGMVSMTGQMATMGIPDPKVQKTVGKLMAMLGKVAGVVGKIDFYKSSASYTTFDGKAWHTHAVTHYFSPAERAKFAGP